MLRESVHFDRFVFFNFFSLDDKLFSTLKSSDKNFFERKLSFLSLVLIIWFFQIDYFYSINRLLKKTRVCYRRCLNQSRIFFLSIRNCSKQSRPPVKIKLICFCTISTSKLKIFENIRYFSKSKEIFFQVMDGSAYQFGKFR
jgi:hypothetical protein